jgi:myo-inositol-1(or 4)-monophosphatase
VLLVREAGGFISDADGGADILEKGSVCAGNEAMQRHLLGLIRAS